MLENKEKMFVLTWLKVLNCSTNLEVITAQKMKFSIKDFSSKCDQIRSFLRICSHLLKKFLIENFIFCAVDDILIPKLLTSGVFPTNCGWSVWSRKS